MPMVILLVLFNIGGAIAATAVLQYEGTVMYVVISAFMSANAIFFTALLRPTRCNGSRSSDRLYPSATWPPSSDIIGYFNVAGTSELADALQPRQGLLQGPERLLAHS